MPERLVRPLMDAAKLDENAAKTVTYWRIGATRIKEVKFFPVLGLIGPSGSGKTTIEDSVEVMEPSTAYKFSCAGITVPAARDELAKAYNMVAIAEEFDQLPDQMGASRFFQARCDRRTSALAYKERLTDQGAFRPKTIEVFGATVLHARNPLADPALVSRAIQVFTRHRPGPYPEFCIGETDFADVVAMVDWDIVATGVDANGRLYDTWYPVLRVAAGLGDTDWLKWAEMQIKMLQTRLEEAAGYDHRQVILARVIEILVEREEQLIPGDIWERINVNDEIGDRLRKTSLPRISPWEVADIVKGLGFKTTRKGGRLWLLPSPVSVLLACQENGYEDEWLDGLKEQINLALSGT